MSNDGAISNTDTDSGIGVLIDTTCGNLVSTGGFASTGTIDVGGNGTSKRGIVDHRRQYLLWRPSP